MRLVSLVAASLAANLRTQPGGTGAGHQALAQVDAGFDGAVADHSGDSITIGTDAAAMMNPDSMVNAGMGGKGPSLNTGVGTGVIDQFAKHSKTSIGDSIQKDRRRRGTGPEYREKMKKIKKMGMVENVQDLKKMQEEYEADVFARMDALAPKVEKLTKPTMAQVLKAAFGAETAAQFLARATTHDVPQMVANFTTNWTVTSGEASRHAVEVLNKMRTEIGKDGILDSTIQSMLGNVVTKANSAFQPIFQDRQDWQKMVDNKMALADEDFQGLTNDILSQMADVSKDDRKEMEKVERGNRVYNAEKRKEQKIAQTGLKRFSTFEVKYLKEMMTMVVAQESYMTKDMMQMQRFLAKIRKSTDKYWKRVVKRGNKAVLQAYKKGLKQHDKTKDAMADTLEELVGELEEVGHESTEQRESAAEDIESMFERALAAAEATQGSANSIGELASEVQLGGKARLQMIEADAKDEQRASDDAAKAASTMRRKRINDFRAELAPLAREKAKWVDEQVQAGDKGLQVFDEKTEDFVSGLYTSMSDFEDDAKSGAKDLAVALTDATAMLEELQGTIGRSSSYQMHVVEQNEQVKQEGLTMLDDRATKMQAEIAKTFEYLPTLSKQLSGQLSTAKMDVKDEGREQKRKAYLSMGRAVGTLDNTAELAISDLSGALAKQDDAASTSGRAFDDVLNELATTLNNLVNTVIPNKMASITDSAEKLDQDRAEAERPLLEQTGKLIERTEAAMKKLVSGYMKGKAALVDTAQTLMQQAQGDLDTVVGNAHQKLKKLEYDDHAAKMYADARMEAAVDRTQNLEEILSEDVTDAKVELRSAEGKTAGVQQRAGSIRAKATKAVSAMEADVDGDIKAAVQRAVEPVERAFEEQQAKAQKGFDEVKAKLKDTENTYLTKLSATGADTDERIVSLNDAVQRAQTEYDAELLKSTGMANSLFTLVSDAEHELSISGVMKQKDAAQRQAALARRADHLHGEIDRTYGVTNAALAATMKHTVSMSHDEMAKVVSDQSLSDEEIEEALHAEDGKLKDELTTLVHRSSGLSQSSQLYMKDLSADSTAVGGNMVAAEQGEVQRETAEKQAAIGVGQDEAGAMGSQASNAEVILGALGSMNAAAKGYVKHAEDQWKRRQASLSDETSDIVKAAHSGATAIAQRAKSAHVEAELSLNGTMAEVQKLQASVAGLKNEVEGNYLSVAEGLKAEKEGLNHDAGRIQQTAEASVSAVAQSVETMVGAVASIADTAHKTEQAQSELRGVHHEQLTHLQQLEHNHNAEHVAAMLDIFKQLDAKHEEMHQWNAGFDGRTTAWRQTVTEKLAELGYDITSESRLADSSDANAHRELKEEESELGAEVSKELAAIADRANAEIEDLYASSDAKIQRILADESLSEDEKQKLIREAEAETAKAATAIFAKQSEMERKHIQMEQEVGRYNSMVAAAKSAVEAAIASGSLSPSAVAIYRKLLKVSDELGKLRAAPWLGGPASALEVAATDRPQDRQEKPSDVVHAANEAIRSADASLRQHIAQLEARVDKAKHIQA